MATLIRRGSGEVFPGVNLPTTPTIPTPNQPPPVSAPSQPGTFFGNPPTQYYNGIKVSYEQTPQNTAALHPQGVGPRETTYAGSTRIDSYRIDDTTLALSLSRPGGADRYLINLNPGFYVPGAGGASNVYRIGDPIGYIGYIDPFTGKNLGDPWAKLSSNQPGAMPKKPFNQAAFNAANRGIDQAELDRFKLSAATGNASYAARDLYADFGNGKYISQKYRA